MNAELDQLDREARAAATPEEALETYRRIERIATEVERPFAVLAAQIGQAGAFLRVDQLDSAENALRAAVNGAIAVGHDYNAAVAYDGLATVFERRGWTDSAVAALEHTVTHIERRGEADPLLARIQERLTALEHF